MKRIINFIACLALAGCVATPPPATTIVLQPTHAIVAPAESKSDAAAQFMRWNKANGKTLNGLTARRAAERDLFMGKGLNYYEVKNGKLVKVNP